MKKLKKINRLKAETLACIVAMLLVVAYSVGLIVSAAGTGASTDSGDKNAGKYSFEYENKLFDTSKVHTIDIKIKVSDWQNLKDTAIEKNYYSCDVIIDGETMNKVGVRTKGNSTLVQSIAQGWDRQSLVINFGKFNKSQRYYGLDKLSLYNNACDSSFMKNMICLEMMRSQGIATPLCSFTAVYLNGKYVGLYTAFESVDESFSYRNFGGKHGNLYKPEQYDVSALLTGEKTNVSINLGALTDNSDSIEISDFLRVSDKTVGLNYQGDNLALYDEIWNNSVFKASKSDKKRLVNALKNISEGNAKDYADIEELAKYFAVNAFVLNTDDYLTNMAHNYYLYEKDGVLSMLPWDYDQTMGTVGAVGSSGEITEFINTPIDEPLTNTTLSERPMLAAVLNDTYGKSVYYDTLGDILGNWIYNGKLDKYMTSLENLIRPYVETDPNMKDRTDVFKSAVASVREFCSLRAESIKGQFDESISKTIEGQKAAPETLVDASNFSSPDSGSFFDMLMKSNSDIALEDIAERLLGQINVISVFKTMPISDVPEIKELFTEKDNESVQKLVDAGLVKDKERLKNVLVTCTVKAIRPIGLLIISIVMLVAMLIFVKHYKNGRRPAARRIA